jgi:hypothetical protein
MKVLAVLAAAAGASVFGCRREIKFLEPPKINNPVVDVRTDPGDPLFAGFAREAITPGLPVWLAGFGWMRPAWRVHDDLYARALVLKQGDEKLALVALDLIGVQLFDIKRIKDRIDGFGPNQVIIASTHTHSGPDTMGLWGIPPLLSGKNEDYMERLGRAVAGVVERAEASAVPVSAWTAVYPMDPEIMYNANEGEPEDEIMGLVLFKDGSDKVVATLINLAGHPEVMWGDNHTVTADYPGVIYRRVEERYGGGAVFFNGALGAMITPRLPQDPGRTWEDVERIGSMVADEVDRGMGLLVKEKAPRLVHRMSLIRFPLKNDKFIMLGEFGILERDMYEGPSLITEVHLIEIGSAQFVTFPGEAYPKLGIKIRERQKPNSFQIGLADDELGYILYPEDYGTELYRYETSMCAGPELAVEIERELLRLMEE